MQKLVWQNANGDSIDLTSGNYGITQWEGFSNTSLNIQSQQVPFQDGAVFLDALLNQRELSVTLKMQDNGNLEERYRMRRELIHILNPKLGEGYLIYTNDFISKRIKCVAQVPLFETHNSDTRGTPKASLSWTATIPYWEDVNEISVEIANGELKTVNYEGDVPTGIKATFIGSGSDIMIENVTTERKIAVDYDFQDGIEIDTNVGEKSLQEVFAEYKYKSGGLWYGVINRYGRLIVVGAIISVIKPNGELITENVVNVMNDIVQNKETIVAVDGNGYIYYSNDDGDSWTRTIIEETNLYSQHVSVNEVGEFILLQQRTSSTSTRKYYKSSNGYEWTETTSSEYVAIDKEKIYDGEKWVRLDYPTSNSVKIQTSFDNSNWTDVTTINNVGYIEQIIYAYGTYTIVGQFSNILNSRNLTEWNTVSGYKELLYGIKASFTYNGIIYCVGSSSTAFYTDDNFATVHKMNISPESYYVDFVDVLRHDNVIIILTNDIYYYISTDAGQTFTKVNMTGTDPYYPPQSTYAKIKYINGVYYILVGTNILVSPDTQNWTAYKIFYSNYGSTQNISCTDFCVVNGEFYFTSNRYVRIWKCSELGQACEIVYPSSTETEIDGELYSIIYANGMLVAVGQYLVPVVVIKNGIATTPSLDIGENTLNKIYFSDGLFKLLGYNGIYIETQDFVNLRKYELNVKKDIILNAYIELGNNIWLCGIYSEMASYCLFKRESENKKNIINHISKDSDIGLNLQVGENKYLALIDGVGKAVLTYRQKYLGV